MSLSSDISEQLAAEIRIQQSVLVVRNMPVLGMGNAAAIGVVAFVEWDVFLSSYAIIPALLLLILLTPLALSYVRLRKAPRPTSVSERRIRRLETHSLLMGLAWTATIVLYIPVVNPTDQIVVMMIMTFLWYGGIAMLPSMPRAALAYVLPAWAIINAIIVFDGVHDPLFMSLILWIAVAAVFATCRQNWLDFRSNTEMSIERTRIIRENLEAEAKRQLEIAETQRHVINAIPFPLVLTKKTSVLPIGQQAADLFKIKPEELPNHQISDFFVNPADRDKMFHLMETDGQFDELEAEFKDAEGNHIWAMTSSRPIEYEGEQCFLSSIIPIDERKRLEAEREHAREEALEKSRILNLTLDNMGQGLVMYDAHWKLMSYNARYRDHFNLPDDIFEGDVSFDDVVGATMRQDYGDEWRERLDLVRDPIRMTSVWRREFERPNGRSLDVLSNPIPSGGFVVTTTDVTERKQFEKDLAAAKDDAEAANKAKSQFLANMSHELRTPMNAILGYTELIQDNIYGEVSDKIRDVLSRVENNGHNLLTQINDVLDLSKIEAGEFSITVEEYSMGDLVDGVISDVASLASDKNLKLASDLPPDLPVGLGDDRRLNQILVNLVGNAIKFTDEGEVSINVKIVGEDFCVSVTDTGIGISEEDQALILDEFYQADASTTREYGGTGLGLAIAKRMIELHGGQMLINSNLGQGSTFTFQIPIRTHKDTAAEIAELEK